MITDHAFTLKLATGEIVTGPIQGSGGTIHGSDAARRLQIEIKRADKGTPLGIYEPMPGHASLHLPDPNQDLPVDKRTRPIDLRGATLIEVPVVTLRKLQIVTRMSHETICFTADVYLNGKRVGTAENTGHGGSTGVFFDDRKGGKSPSEDLIAAYVRDVLKPEHCFDGPAAHMVDDLVFQELGRREAALLAKKIARIDAKEMARFAKQGMRCVRFTVGDDIRWAGLPPDKTLDDLREHFTKKYGELAAIVVVG